MKKTIYFRAKGRRVDCLIRGLILGLYKAVSNDLQQIYFSQIFTRGRPNGSPPPFRIREFAASTPVKGLRSRNNYSGCAPSGGGSCREPSRSFVPFLFHKILILCRVRPFLSHSRINISRWYLNLIKPTYPVTNIAKHASSVSYSHIEYIY